MPIIIPWLTSAAFLGRVGDYTIILMVIVQYKKPTSITNSFGVPTMDI